MATGDWVIMYENNGFIGARPELMQPLSVGRDIVVHHGSENSYFFWYVDGESRTWFETLFAAERNGSTPDELVPIMRQIGGFELEPDESVKITEFHPVSYTQIRAHETAGMIEYAVFCL